MYAALFVIFFLETGVILCAFLPGDSLLVVAGAAAAKLPSLSLAAVWAVCTVAATAGAAFNYAVGRRFVDVVASWEDAGLLTAPAQARVPLRTLLCGAAPGVSMCQRLRRTGLELCRKALHRDNTHSAKRLFAAHGSAAVVIARFLPLARTFVPFLAGVATMSAPHFMFFNCTGALLWVTACSSVGFYGADALPVAAIVGGIVAVSLLPVVAGWLRLKSRRPSSATVLPP